MIRQNYIVKQMVKAYDKIYDENLVEKNNKLKEAGYKIKMEKDTNYE